jgi:iron(III) transport system substrate-binding protein
MYEQGQTHLQTFAGLPVTRRGAPPLSKIPATSALRNVVDGEAILTPERQRRIVERWRSVFGVR